MVCCLIRPSNGFARDLINNKIIALYFFIWILTNLVHEKQWVYNTFIHGFIGVLSVHNQDQLPLGSG